MNTFGIEEKDVHELALACNMFRYFIFQKAVDNLDPVEDELLYSLFKKEIYTFFSSVPEN